MLTLAMTVAPVVRLLLLLLLQLIIFYLLLLLEEGRTGKYRHVARFVLTGLVVVVGSPWGVPLIPCFIAATSLGYLILDPGVDHMSKPAVEEPTRWGRFWRTLTDREQPEALWSAYVEALVALLSIVWYAYLVTQ
jgi:hypothetical protein